MTRPAAEETEPVSVSVRIPTILRTYTDGASEVTADGATLAEVLEHLDQNFSGIKGRIVDESGEITRRVVIVRRPCHTRLRGPRRASAGWCRGRP